MGVVGVMMCVEGVWRRVCRRYLDIRVGGRGWGGGNILRRVWKRE